MTGTGTDGYVGFFDPWKNWKSPIPWAVMEPLPNGRKILEDHSKWPKSYDTWDDPTSTVGEREGTQL